MSEVLGPLGYDHADGRAPSQEEARLIHHEARRLADDAYQRARAILSAQRPTLDRLAEALLDHETVTAAELDQLTMPPPRPAGKPRETVPRPTPADLTDHRS